MNNVTVGGIALAAFALGLLVGVGFLDGPMYIGPAPDPEEPDEHALTDDQRLKLGNASQLYYEHSIYALAPPYRQWDGTGTFGAQIEDFVGDMEYHIEHVGGDPDLVARAPSDVPYQGDTEKRLRLPHELTKFVAHGAALYSCAVFDAAAAAVAEDAAAGSNAAWNALLDRINLHLGEVQTAVTHSDDPPRCGRNEYWDPQAGECLPINP